MNDKDIASTEEFIELDIHDEDDDELDVNESDGESDDIEDIEEIEEVKEPEVMHLTDDFKNLQKWNKVGVQYLTDDLDRGLHSLNAFFTCYVDMEYFGELNLSLLQRKGAASDKLAASYFGLSVDGEVMFNGVQTTMAGEVLLHGVQTKNLYKMVKFITENNLWPTIKTSRRRLKFWKKKIITDKRFSDVVNALDDLKDPELTECLRSYPAYLFAGAYTMVGLKGHEYIMNLQAAEAGRMAYRDVCKRIYSVKGEFFKKLFLFVGAATLAYVAYSVFASGILMTL
ncbi:hypothetical protein [Pseudomonas putida]|uniref:Uncharacterized protein n=1 Tax=Pseudomonas putida TaxID=303 RepID=A0AAD0L5D5_PSEPU|nr:hypothetical protein [Pseudomonas putida]AXA24268.1 hypothetical protein C1S65_09145 [Pseudomonas putida]